MKALKTTDNFLLFEAEDIRFGKLEPEDINTETGEPVEKWGMYDADGNIMLYAIDNDFEVVEFDPADKPEDYSEGKYFYIDGKFVLNPDWQEPPLPIEEQVQYLAGDQAQLAADLDFMAMELNLDLES